MLAIAVKQRPWIGISDNVQVKEQGEFHRKMLENEFQSKMAKSEFDTLMEMKMKFMWLAIYIQIRDLGPRMTFKYQPLQGIHLMKRLKTTFSVSSQLISFPTAHHQKMLIVADVRSYNYKEKTANHIYSPFSLCHIWEGGRWQDKTYDASSNDNQYSIQEHLQTHRWK